MATASKWNPFGVALNVTATASTVTRTSATQYTVKINVSWETYYSGNATNYGMKAESGGKSVTISSFGTSRSSGSSTLTGTYSISGNGSASKTVTVKFTNYNSDNDDSASKSVSFTVTVPAWTSYTVSYDANGGSGAPSSQTKWKDQTLTLSTTKPTRTGYSFQGWGTSASDTSVDYAAGADYTANSAITLYAIWKVNTYTVTFNVNGGVWSDNTTANKTLTKTYGTTLKLSTTAPTRTNYSFLGWGTSASSTTVAYAAGASYTANAAITLYAIWELQYEKPTITSLKASRCTADGTAEETGTYFKLSFNWSCCQLLGTNTVNSITYQIDSGTETAISVSTTLTSGSVSVVLGGAMDVDTTYSIKVSVTDSMSGTTPQTVTLPASKFLIDFKAGGDGVAVGKPATESGYFDVGFYSKFNKNAYFPAGVNIHGIHPDDGNTYAALLPVTDSGNTSLGYGLYNAGKGNTYIYGNGISLFSKTNINANRPIVSSYNSGNGFIHEGSSTDVGFLAKRTDTSVEVKFGVGSGGTNRGIYDVSVGAWLVNFDGTDIQLRGNGANYKPYYTAGDTVTVTNFHTAGYVTSSSQHVRFHLPLAKPVIGATTATAASIDGLTLREEGYTHGSSSTAWTLPSYYTAAIEGGGNHVLVIAAFSTTTNALNNQPIGINWSGKITFS